MVNGGMLKKSIILLGKVYLNMVEWIGRGVLLKSKKFLMFSTRSSWPLIRYMGKLLGDLL
jgi:hypothetical protein